MRAVVMVSILGLVLSACGGGAVGGGGGGSPEPTPGAPPTPDPRPVGSGTVAGTVEIPAGAGAVIQDREPNDTVDQAQGLGPVEDRVAVSGSLDAGDVVDGFRVFAPERRLVSVLLAHAPEADFELYVYDMNALRVVAHFDAPGTRVQGTFLAAGAFDVVVNRKSGSGRYVLRVETAALAGPVYEVEPNDTVADAHYLGGITGADRIDVAGFADADSDASDLFALSTEAPTRLDIAVAFPSDADYDLYAYDVTDGTVVEIGASYSASDNPERLQVLLPANRLIVVQMHAWAGSGAYELTLDTSADGTAVLEEALASTRAAPVIGEPIGLDHPYGQPAHEVRAGEVIVVAAPGRDIQSLKAELAAAGYEWLSGGSDGPQLFGTPVSPFLEDSDATRLTLARAAALARRRAVAIAEPNGTMVALEVPNDSYYGNQWHYPMMRLPEAWDTTVGSASVRVAVVDTGSTPHPDLAGRWVSGYDFVSLGADPQDGDGYDPDPTDPGDSGPSWHGTHVAGTIGANTDNGSGVAGVTWATQIMPVRVLGYEGGSTYDVMQGVLYAAGLPNAAGVFPDRRADVINMSLGGGSYQSAFQDVIDRVVAAGVVVVAAAGNSGSSEPHYPSAYDGVISVGAVGPTRTLAYYSNWGSTVDVVAPGGDQSYDTEDGVLSTSWSGSSPTYRWYQGTSMASPHVAGVVALLLSVAPGLSPAQVETLLEANATDLGAPGFDLYYAHGLVDAARSVESALAYSNLDPVLALPSVLDLSWTRAEQGAPIQNAGGRRLEVGAPVVVEGAAWLTAWLEGVGDARKSHDRLVVHANTAALPLPGAYSGRVFVPSNGGNAEVLVLVEVLDLSAPIDAVVHVLLVDASTGATVASTTISGLARAFELAEVPSGSYRLVAGTDVDGDGWIGGDGELFGWMDGEPGHVLLLGSGEYVADVRVPVGPEAAGTAPRFRR